MVYKLKLDVFEGPLDLLLYLIKKDDIDITDIPIVEITEQYMQYIELMKMLDLDVVGDFLVMAATLIQIKSKMLLPPDPSEEEEEEIDPRDELAKRLLEYKKFKEVAETLQDKEAERKNLFARLINEENQDQLKKDSREVYIEASLFDLINALTEAMNRTPEEVIHEIVKEEYKVEDKINHILQVFKSKGHINLRDMFKACSSKREMIVTFLATLELIRLSEVMLVQKKIFGDIELVKRDVQITDESQPAVENS